VTDLIFAIFGLPQPFTHEDTATPLQRTYISVCACLFVVIQDSTPISTVF